MKDKAPALSDLVVSKGIDLLGITETWLTNMKLKRTNATKRSEQLELNLLKEEICKNKYNIEVQNSYERLCIEEREQQPDNGSFNNQCDKKMDYC